MVCYLLSGEPAIDGLSQTDAGAASAAAKSRTAPSLHFAQSALALQLHSRY
jgi:hypothetical protein